MKTPWNKGKKFPYKPRPGMKGKIPWHKGKKGVYSEEAKRKMSLAHKGVTPWNKGRKETRIEVLKMISEGQKGRIPWNKGLKGYRAGIPRIKPNSGYIPWNKGLTKKGESKLRGGYPKGKKHSFPRSKEYRQQKKIARSKQILPVKDTKIEVRIQNFLKQLGIKFFTHQYMKEIEHGYQCDILIPSMKMVIECDGIYWHKYPIGKETDIIRSEELRQKGYKVLRLWETEINNLTIPEFEFKLGLMNGR